jgi:hypothetical protein
MVEASSYVLSTWSADRGVFVQSFISKCGDECLSEQWAVSLGEAEGSIEAWRRELRRRRAGVRMTTVGSEESISRRVIGGSFRTVVTPLKPEVV